MPVLFTKRTDPETTLCVWHAMEDPSDLYARLHLDPEDLQRVEAIRNQNRKRQWLGCRMALSHLMQTSRIGIRYNEYGKPFLDSGRGSISFTHTGLFAAAIFSTSSEVGIDMEQVRDKIGRVAERFLSQQELSMASGKDRLEILTLFWAAKETLYKINGKPDLDMQHELCIESFDYLCAADGELKTRINAPGLNTGIRVAYHRLNDFIVAWAQLPGNK